MTDTLGLGGARYEGLSWGCQGIGVRWDDPREAVARCLHVVACVTQEYLKDYGTEEMQKIGADLIDKEKESGLTDSAKRLLQRKMDKVAKGEHDVYI